MTILTPAEAASALYVDFEGREQEPPVLLGTLGPAERFVQHVLDPLFRGALQYRPRSTASLGELREGDLPGVARWLAGRLEHEDRLLVAWSIHEKEVLLAGADSSRTADVIGERFRNGIETAKRWLRMEHPEVKLERDPYRGTHRLEEYMRLIGYPVPAIHGTGLTGKRVRNVRAGLVQNDGQFRKLSKGRKANWTNLLIHNFHDCFGMREVITRAAGEL